jgi:ABC-2 type transport system ATP-binding protein
MSELAIDIRGATKTYRGKVRALRGVDMRVARGEIFGLLGPNGAGKSTLVKILMTVIRSSGGGGSVLGRPIGDKAALAKVGYLPEHHRFPDYLKGWQVLDFYGAMAGVRRRERKARTGALLDLVGMGAWGDKRIKQYSKGMRQRVGLAQALMNDPELVLLDEPTDGVDPVGRREIRGICQRLKEEGRTVFLNSHLLSELEMVCDRVAILVQGQVASQGTIDELTAHQRWYEIELAADPADGERALRSALPGVSLPALPAEEGGRGEGLARVASARGALATGEWVEVDRSRLRIGTDDAGVVRPVLERLVAQGATIRAVRPHRPSLEDLFMQAVTDPTTGAVLKPGAAGETRRKGEP